VHVLNVKKSDQTRSLGKRFSTTLALAIALVASTARADDFDHLCLAKTPSLFHGKDLCRLRQTP
jgi:hypothetical protein